MSDKNKKIMLHRKKFAEKVLDLCREQKITLSELALFTRIDYNRLKRILECDICPSLEEASTILAVLSHPLIIS